MSRKGESIFKRKDGRYEGRYIKEYRGNKAIYGYVYAKNYNECKKKRNELLLNYHVEKPTIKKVSNSNKDLNYLIDKWLYSKTNIKESSYTFYYNLINEHIRSYIGKTKLNKLSSELVNNYLNSLLDKGRIDKNGGLSKNYVYVIRSILNQVFKENNIDIDMIKISLNTGVGKSLYNDEKIKLIDKLIMMNNNISIGILLSLFLGLRKSEVCGIRFCDIDLNNKVLYINNIVSRVKSFNTRNKTKIILSTPKTDKSKRILPIPDKIVNMLSNIEIYNNNYFLVTNSNKIMDPRTFYNHYKRILNQLNINYTYHDLRHTFATNCVELGIDYKSLMELLGHSSITTTMNIYVHPTLNNKRFFVNQL